MRSVNCEQQSLHNISVVYSPCPLHNKQIFLTSIHPIYLFPGSKRNIKIMDLGPEMCVAEYQRENAELKERVKNLENKLERYEKKIRDIRAIIGTFVHLILYNKILISFAAGVDRPKYGLRKRGANGKVIK
jgi:hypothetical protein